MSDTNFMISPAGYIVDIRHDGPPQPGVGSMGDHIVRPLLKGAVFHVRGDGATAAQRFISGLSGVQGTFEVYFVTGAQGAQRTVAMLTNDELGAIVLGVDALNQPFAVVFDALGRDIATITLNIGSTPAGTALIIRLIWDSNASLLSLEGQGLSASSSGLIPGSQWEHFMPTSLWLAGSGGVAPYAEFNGEIHKVQASNLVLPTTEPTQVIEPGLQAQARLQGAASLVVQAELRAGFTGQTGTPLSMPTHFQLGVV